MRMIRLTAESIAKILADPDGARPLLPSCALTIGSFDGLHLGHQELIRRVADASYRQDLDAAAVFTFVQSPRQVLNGEAVPFQLTTWRAKLAALHNSPCEVLVAADFSPELAALDYRDFVRIFLVGLCGMKHFVAGWDMRMGKGRQGTAEDLKELGRETGFTTEVCEPVAVSGEIISSSAIREAVRAGDMPRARRLLGRPYGLWGVVGAGDSRGHTIGYPTANVEPLADDKLLPEPGVYAVRVRVPGDIAPEGTPGVLDRVRIALPEVDRDGALVGAAPADWAVFGGMLNYGSVPTFHGDGLPRPRVEANLFGFEGELQGRTVKVEWMERLRAEQRFDGVDELVAQLEADAAAARQILGMS
ncbi:MAG: bifunctional riboflavin kinase/FMN adenylyltransferase [bacterium]|nr:bifunctional riboflavin kinase/FMN adenylyltransferase [bacterium]